MQTNVPVLREIGAKRLNAKEYPPNLLIEGDNYHALSVLNYTHKKKIDLIYIDPPYNTGARTTGNTTTITWMVRIPIGTVNGFHSCATG